MSNILDDTNRRVMCLQMAVEVLGQRGSQSDIVQMANEFEKYVKGASTGMSRNDPNNQPAQLVPREASAKQG